MAAPHPRDYLSREQLKRLYKLKSATAGVSLASAAGGLTGKTAGKEIVRVREEHQERESNKARGLKDVRKAEEHLEDVAKYVRRSVPNPRSELDVLAAANMMLDATHKGSIIPFIRRRQLRDQLKAAIARQYLNAPYTVGGP